MTITTEHMAARERRRTAGDTLAQLVDPPIAGDLRGFPAVVEISPALSAEPARLIGR